MTEPDKLVLRSVTKLQHQWFKYGAWLSQWNMSVGHFNVEEEDTILG